MAYNINPINPYGAYREAKMQREDRQQQDYAAQLAQMYAGRQDERAQQQAMRQQQQFESQQAAAETAAQKESEAQQLKQSYVQAQRILVAPPGQRKFVADSMFDDQDKAELLAQGIDYNSLDDEGIAKLAAQLENQIGEQLGISPEVNKGPKLNITPGPMGSQIITYDNTMRVLEPQQPDKPAAPPAGYRWSAGNTLEPIAGGPADKSNQPDKPATEGDKRAKVMYRSMTNAEKQIEAVTGADTSNLGQAILGKIGGGKVLQTDEYKRYEAAGLRWAANLLYLKSGATATPEEIQSTWRQFFPQIGDGPSVKAQKDEARQQEMGAINDSYEFGDNYQGRGASKPGAITEGTVIEGTNGQRMVLRGNKWVPL